MSAVRDVVGADAGPVCCSYIMPFRGYSRAAALIRIDDEGRQPSEEPPNIRSAILLFPPDEAKTSSLIQRTGE